MPVKKAPMLSTDLQRRLDGGDWNAEVMTEVTPSTFSGAIPGQPAGTTIEYECAAIDNDGEISRMPEENDVYTFQVAP